MKAAWPAIVAAVAFGLALPLPAQQGITTLAGRVTDARTMRGVADAQVQVVRGSEQTSTDSSGRWSLRVPDSSGMVLRVAHPRYVAREVAVRDERRGPIAIALEPVPRILEAVVVTASRREQRLSDAVVETSLIDATELRRSGSPDLAQVLAEQSGLQLDGGTPAGAGVQLRGFDSRRVLVLIDGQPMVGRVDGNFDLSRLPVSMVERVEIVKGPQSTLYGSEALGGVINIITHRATDPGWSAGITSGAGTQGRLEGGVDLRWRRGTVGIAIDGGGRGIELAPGIAGDNGTYARRGNGFAAVDWDARPNTRLSASALGVQERQRYRAGQLFRFADNTQLAGRLTAAHRFAPANRLTASLHGSTFDHLSRASTLDEPVPGSGERDRQTLVVGEVLWNALFGSVAVDAGTQVRDERITADRVSGRHRQVSGVEPFVQASAALGPVTVVPGMRVSWSDRWGRFVAPRLATMWRPVDAVALRASVGRGFRAPDFKELYIDFVNSGAGYAVQGNPDLKPEESTAYALSGEYAGRALRGRVGAFLSTYSDFIETSEPDAAGTYTYRNLDRGTMRGLELEGGFTRGQWSADAGIDLLRTKDRASATPLLGRPRESLRASLTGPGWPGLRATAAFVYTGRTGVLERGGWSRLDLRATQALGRGLQWSFGVQNAFDRRMGTAWPGFTGRQFATSLEWRIGSGN
jgi:outer membrane receptor for ferrienterochelin and colicins